MQSALRTLLDGVIDYAGLFPPAKHSMREAVSRYLRYVQGPEEWMLGRFLCPAGRLLELESELDHQGSEVEVPVGVVGTGGSTLETFEAALEEDIGHMNAFQDAAGERASVEAFEVRTPSLAETPAAIADLEGFSGVEAYLEVPLAEGLDEALAAIAETDWMGAKARTGGLEPSAFPPSHALAGFIRECSHLDLSYKLTAGLHEPLYRKHPGMDAMAHGFLNVLVGAALMEAHDLSRDELQEVLEERHAFGFGSGIAWRELTATENDVRAARELFVAFGSCSVDEPVDGLRRAGLL
ncbi:MAG TPA: hypothetical protein VM328_03000 [Fimbriimonadaceae bacterium]|nr:hypothetical protein [Fimbriimonadaceae bacterium]